MEGNELESDELMVPRDQIALVNLGTTRVTFSSHTFFFHVLEPKEPRKDPEISTVKAPDAEEEQTIITVESGFLAANDKTCEAIKCTSHTTSMGG